MVKQFLLNPDGSIPAGARLDILIAEGIPLVLPTERWTPKPGFMLEERDPVQDEDGVWRQTWVEVAVPEPLPQEVTNAEAG